MSKQTHKWLPSEPTVEMVNAGINVWLNQENPNKPINFVEIFKAMWEKATEVEQEPYAYATLLENGEWSVVQGIEPNTTEHVPLYTHNPT